MKTPLKSPDARSIRKRAQSVTIEYRTPGRRPTTQVVIDATELKVCAVGEGKTRQYDREKHWIWCQ